MRTLPVVLVVDDEPMVVKMLEASIKSLNYGVLTAPDGRTALELVQGDCPRVDIVMTDIRMPGMNGVCLQREIKELRPDIPVIMMTGYTDFEMVVEALKQHAFDIIFKPLEMDQIAWCLDKASSYVKYREMQKNYLAMLEKQVAEQTAKLRIQLEELEEARAISATVDELKSEFLGIVGHEFRTPLNGIKGIVQILDEDPSAENIATFLPLLKDSTNKLQGLIENIMTLARIKSLKTISETDCESVECAVKTVMDSYNRKAEEKNITLETSFRHPSGAVLRGPWEAVQTVLAVFIDNAMKFTDPGGKIICSVEAIPLLEPSEEESVKLTVTDSGIGIQKEDLQKIFKPFVQLENFLTRRYSGGGLGLAIAESFAERLGGQISVNSDPGKGSTFTCSFRFRKSRNDNQDVSR